MWRENLTNSNSSKEWWKGIPCFRTRKQPKTKEESMWEPSYCIEIETWTLGTSGNNNTTLMILALTWLEKKRPNGIMIEAFFLLFFPIFQQNIKCNIPKKRFSIKMMTNFFLNNQFPLFHFGFWRITAHLTRPIP
jgi:hypothetical protein